MDWRGKRGGAAVKLLTQELKRKLPPLYSTDGEGDEAIAQVKFFIPDSNWTWYVTEFDGDDTFFGLVDGTFLEKGYFTLSELESVRGPWGLKVERDLHFQPTALADLEVGV
jgi:hypothetical protein